EAALFGRDFQLPLALAGERVLLGIEAREVLSDDLVRSVALDPLGAGVPRGDVALGIEHEDGVVLDAFDEELEPLVVSLAALVVPPQPFAESRLQMPPLLDFLLQRSRAPRERRGAIRRDHVGVPQTNSFQYLAVSGLVEVTHRVRAKERE